MKYETAKIDIDPMYLDMFKECKPTGNPMHKHLKISAELHTEIKKEAKTNGMFIDAFLRKALEDHRKQKMLRELRGL